MQQTWIPMTKELSLNHLFPTNTTYFLAWFLLLWTLLEIPIGGSGTCVWVSVKVGTVIHAHNFWWITTSEAGRDDWDLEVAASNLTARGSSCEWAVQSQGIMGCMWSSLGDDKTFMETELSDTERSSIISSLTAWIARTFCWESELATIGETFLLEVFCVVFLLQAHGDMCIGCTSEQCLSLNILTTVSYIQLQGVYLNLMPSGDMRAFGSWGSHSFWRDSES